MWHSFHNCTTTEKMNSDALESRGNRNMNDMNETFEKYKQHISRLCGVDCHLFDVRLKKFTKDISFCRKCPKFSDYTNTHLYGCYEAQRWGNKYIYYCPRGFIFIAVAISDEMDIMDYGVIAGPILMGEAEEEQQPFLSILPLMSTGQVNDLTEIMVPVFCRTLQISRQQENIQAEVFLNEIYKVAEEEKENTSPEYPIFLEQDLKNSIIEGNSERAKDVLNLLLGHIFFHTAGELSKIKERVTELIVQLSRFSIEGGADIPQIFSLNHNYLKEIERFENIEQLSVWLSSVINQYIAYVFEFRDIKHSDIIHKAVRYVKENYMKKITLDDVANHVYLSKAYLSRIFKEEMDVSLVNYINQLRIDKSKALLGDLSLPLIDVANLVGFEEQSYFSKVFKKLNGISPGQYRKKRRKEISR